MNINQQPKLPQKPFPIVIIGAGGIVKDAHLPAYTMARFRVLGVYDKIRSKAEALKNEFDIVDRVYDTLEELIAEGHQYNAVYDLALPASLHAEILEQLPDGASVLIQKPMGNTLAEAKQILEICQRKKLISAVNFQLRYAPYIITAREMINKGLLGDIYDMELMVCVYTPWHLWDFLFQLPRVEILYHSIHYLDLIRSFLGSPKKIYASTVKHPKMKTLASTRSTMILDYDECTQARVITNHGHDFGLQHQRSYFKIEGTKGAIKIRIGLSMDYPRGLPAKFEYKLLEDKAETWKEIDIKGGWFPEAFVGTMAGLQRHTLDKSVPLPHHTSDVYETMKLVEAAYQSSEKGGIIIQ
ncbi:Gfo/Idh/MocA family oxidoreductase [Tamlana sp. 2201CG12-4]|uniref:Gfo/Idh/MocA family protein n=1 Tax=Tamlana sp. 2201CG12-4 TaxID=3112582 RepID=UPI002DB58359|nr:Gfo/Idh/MocA family oxidoreductase [Tamlana sp. 2201CG12-4]MEC3908465.1 Gfo/Idh/MocA family oxidoreductase [Tamlana sp. 2201CG12-4]